VQLALEICKSALVFAHLDTVFAQLDTSVIFIGDALLTLSKTTKFGFSLELGIHHFSPLAKFELTAKSSVILFSNYSATIQIPN
jgi:hypothetical protein